MSSGQPRQAQLNVIRPVQRQPPSWKPVLRRVVWGLFLLVSFGIFLAIRGTYRPGIGVDVFTAEMLASIAVLLIAYFSACALDAIIRS